MYVYNCNEVCVVIAHIILNTIVVHSVANNWLAGVTQPIYPRCACAVRVR